MSIKKKSEQKGLLPHTQNFILFIIENVNKRFGYIYIDFAKIKKYISQRENLQTIDFSHSSPKVLIISYIIIGPYIIN